MNFCTNADHSNAYKQGRYWCCRTCGIVDHGSICETCAAICHNGHDLFFNNSGPFFCDCSAYLGKHCCKCCQQRQVCSKVVYPQEEKIEQRKWKCFTCGKSICNACKERCHQYHDVVDEGVDEFACECDENKECKAKEEPPKIDHSNDNYFSLDACGLPQLRKSLRILPDINERQFTIVINKTFLIEIPIVCAPFISAKIAQSLENDPTQTTFEFNIKASRESLEKIALTINCNYKVKIDDEDIVAFYNFGVAIGNDEFMKPYDARESTLNTTIDNDNAVVRIKQKCLHGITDFSKEISFISSHFDEFAQREDFIQFSRNHVFYDTVESILSSSEFKISTEDKLLEFLLSISKDNPHKKEYGRLFSLVFLEYCSPDKCEELLEFVNEFVSSATLRALVWCLGRRVIQPTFLMETQEGNAHYKLSEKG